LGYGNSKCFNAEDVCNCVLSLPVHPSVSIEDINYLIDVITNIPN
jgi:dTDP-4-amino-4,6-dideoxygalactose transaminase